VAAQPQDVQARIRLMRASMTEFRLDGAFATVIIPFRPFQHLIAVEDQLACRRCARAHLATGGRLVFDCFQVNLRKITGPQRTEESEDLPEFELPDGRRLRRCDRIAATHPPQQYNGVEIIYYLTDAAGLTQRVVHRFPFRYFFRSELEHLLARAGYEAEHVYGDFDRSPLADASPEMIFVARKAAGSRGTGAAFWLRATPGRRAAAEDPPGGHARRRGFRGRRRRRLHTAARRARVPGSARLPARDRRQQPVPRHQRDLTALARLHFTGGV
jgi:hypothetical protein